jgi:hypothetical protein
MIKELGNNVFEMKYKDFTIQFNDEVRDCKELFGYHKGIDVIEYMRASIDRFIKDGISPCYLYFRVSSIDGAKDGVLSSDRFDILMKS